MVPAGLALFAALAAGRADPVQQGSLLFTVALFISLSAVIIQYPTFLGRAELTDETLTVVGRLSGRRGRLQIPRESLDKAFFAPLERPPSWLPFIWGIFELLCAIAAASTGWGGGGPSQWYWLTGLVAGLSFWPLMSARWQASMQVVLIYRRPNNKQSGVVRAWATPQQANSLINTLRGRIDWSEPPELLEEE